jgi:hypothetical protein
MAFSLLENILSTCTSSNNPLPESPPTTIILFPMTVAACYTRRRRRKKEFQLTAEHRQWRKLSMHSMKNFKYKGKKTIKQHYVETRSRFVPRNRQHHPVLSIPWCRGTDIQRSRRGAIVIKLVRIISCKCNTFTLHKEFWTSDHSAQNPINPNPQKHK